MDVQVIEIKEVTLNHGLNLEICKFYQKIPFVGGHTDGKKNILHNVFTYN